MHPSHRTAVLSVPSAYGVTGGPGATIVVTTRDVTTPPCTRAQPCIDRAPDFASLEV